MAVLAVSFAALAHSAAVLAQPPTAEYRVGPRDVLAVTVLDEPALSGRFNVLDDGTVAYPLVGSIKVGGLPITAVQTALAARLADGFIDKPVVSVAVEEFGSRRVFVLGDVKQAGSFPLGPTMTVLEALLKAGGPTQTAGGQALVVRGAQGMNAASGTPVARVDLQALQEGDISQNVALQDGDLLYVPAVEAPTPIYIMGLVNAPGAYQLPRGASVLQALAQAGGIADKGSTKRVTIVRKVDGKTAELKAALNDAIQPGDTIVVRRRYF